MSGEKKGNKVNRRQFLKKAGEATVIGAITTIGLGALADPSGVRKLAKAMAEQLPAYGGNSVALSCTSWNCSTDADFSDEGCGGICGNASQGTFTCYEFSCNSPDVFWCTGTEFRCSGSGGNEGHTCVPDDYNMCQPSIFTCTMIGEDYHCNSTNAYE